MSLVNCDVSGIDDKCGEGGGVGRAVGRDIREGFDGVIGREAISAQDIEFFGVVGIVACEVVGEVGDVSNATVAEVAAGFFACFVRTCSCSLVLLGNLAGQRLHENASAFSFAIRASSASCFMNCSKVSL